MQLQTYYAGLGGEDLRTFGSPGDIVDVGEGADGEDDDEQRHQEEVAGRGHTPLLESFPERRGCQSDNGVPRYSGWHLCYFYIILSAAKKTQKGAFVDSL